MFLAECDLSHGVPHLQFASWVSDIFHLLCFNLKLPLAGNVAIAGATFKHHLLHFGEASLRGSNCFIKLFGAHKTQEKWGIFSLILRFQTLHYHLEFLDIPKQRACKCTKSEAYCGSDEWMMSLLEQMCSSISRHVVSFFQLSSFSCSTGWANRWSFSLGTHPPHGAFSTETLKDSHLMIESHVIKDNFTIKCCSGHELWCMAGTPRKTLVERRYAPKFPIQWVWPKLGWARKMSLYSLLGPRRQSGGGGVQLHPKNWTFQIWFTGWQFPSLFSSSMSSGDVALLKEVDIGKRAVGTEQACLSNPCIILAQSARCRDMLGNVS